MLEFRLPKEVDVERLFKDFRQTYLAYKMKKYVEDQREEVVRPFVIKPTKGDFLTEYKNHGNLHIAITNSKGFVVEYDMDGIHKDRTSGKIVIML